LLFLFSQTLLIIITLFATDQTHTYNQPPTTMKFFKTIAFALPLIVFAIAAPAVEKKDVVALQDRQLPQLPILDALGGLSDTIVSTCSLEHPVRLGNDDDSPLVSSQSGLTGAFGIISSVTTALNTITAAITNLVTQLPALEGTATPAEVAAIVGDIVDDILNDVRRISLLTRRNAAVVSRICLENSRVAC